MRATFPLVSLTYVHYVKDPMGLFYFGTNLDLIVLLKNQTMRRKLVMSALVLSIASLCVFISCKKNNGPGDGNARLQVYLTDDPGDYEAVYIDVKDVQINVTGNDADGWQSL